MHLYLDKSFSLSYEALKSWAFLLNLAVVVIYTIFEGVGDDFFKLLESITVNLSALNVCCYSDLWACIKCFFLCGIPVSGDMIA